MTRNFGKFIGVGVCLFLASSVFSSAGAEGVDSWYENVQKAESATVAEPQRYDPKPESRQEPAAFKEAMGTTATTSVGLNALKEAAEMQLQREIAYQEAIVPQVSTVATTTATEISIVGLNTASPMGIAAVSLSNPVTESVTPVVTTSSSNTYFESSSSSKSK